MIQKSEGREESIDVLDSQGKCILHFLDIGNINLTMAYLTSAWNAGAVGANDFYVVSVEGLSQVHLLNFSKIFDFKRLWIVASSGVWRRFERK